MEKIAGAIGIISFIVLASECELTLTTTIVKGIAIAALAGVAFLTTRKPEKIPARRRR